MKSALMSLKARILAGILLAILVPLVIGTTSVLNTRRMAASDQTLFYDGTVPLQILSQIGVSTQRMRIASRDLLEAEGQAQAAKYDHQLDELSGEIDKLTESYAQTELSPEEQTAFQHFEEIRKSYLDYVAQLRTLAHANRSQEGWRILHGEPYNRVVDAHLASIKTLESLQVEQTKQLIAANAGLARSSTLRVLVAMFLAMAFGVSAGLWLDRLSNQTAIARNIATNTRKGSSWCREPPTTGYGTGTWSPARYGGMRTCKPTSATLPMRSSRESKAGRATFTPRTWSESLKASRVPSKAARTSGWMNIVSFGTRDRMPTYWIAAT